MDQVEEIKSKIDIVDLVSSYLELKKAGVNWKALCPFHNEKTPSFMVNSDRGSFHCFGCSEHGDIFTFVEKMEGVDFPEALKILAEKAGVRLQRIEKKFYDQKRNLYEINNLAAKVYHHLLTKDKSGSGALKYLQSRGLADKTIEEFMLGYAPQNFEFISNFLLKKDFKQSDIIASGLSVLRDNQRINSLPIFDRFRGRVMFPLYNPAGNVVGFSGRMLKEQEGVGKYINSPETPVFSKSKTIFGLDKAKPEIRKRGAIILVEGQMDVIMSHQAGFKNTAASSGTAITLEQIKTLRRLSSRFLFAFDADSAGVEATKKAVEMVLNQDGDVLVIDTPAGFKDSAEVIAEDPSLWQKAIKKAVPYLDYLEDKVFLKFKEPFSPQEKRDIALEILPEIAKISDPIVAGDYVARLASRLQTQEKYLFETLRRIQSREARSGFARQATANSQSRGAGSGFARQATANRKQETGSSPHENHLLGLILVFPEYFASIKKLLNESDFNLPKPASIYKKLKKEYSLKRKFALKKFIKSLKSDEQDFVNLIVLDVENEYVEEDKEVAGEEISSLIARIKKGNKEALSKNFEGQIKEAEKSGNKEKIKKLIREFQDLIVQGKK